MQPRDEDTQQESGLQSNAGRQGPNVGYGQPPLATRFRKGQSGNPKGRPKGARNLKTLLREALNEKITVNENGKRRAITKMQAGVKQLANKVASGDVKTTLKLVDLHYRDEELERATNGAESGSLASSLPESATAHEKLREITERLLARLAKRNASAS
jgi:hypothetical protein